ncbi:MAG: zinc-dependent alcohol dehydrogenase family protein [Pseudodesulfovibrio sp.]|nr:zinc-dependent alcohol dehydrogenase family protein [Pseudodesulfovibrio sp.]
MKAMLLEQYGSEYAFVEHEIERPEPRPGEVLVKVAGTSLNPVDNKIATMGEQLIFSPPLPAILGMDMSGVVVDVGSGMSRFKLGDKVFGCAGGVGRLPGALAEYMIADERLIAPAPHFMDLVEAATLPLASITAWLALFGKASLKAGQSLLVHGGTGGVGHIAVQLGVYAGATVHVTVSSSDKAAIVEELGGIPINYREKGVAQYVADTTFGDGFDVVFDTVGGFTLDSSFQAAKIGGQVVSTATRSSHDLGPMHAKSLSLHVVFALLPMMTGEGRSLHGQILTEIAGLVDADRLLVLIDEKQFDFTEIAQAHRYWESGTALGKISVKVSD